MIRIATVLFLFSVFFLELKAQNVFPEKFEGCDTKMFALESDTTEARICNRHFMDVFMESLSEEVKNSISGRLGLQIIVYKDGSSCLLSVDNGTNIPTNQLIFKESIDNELNWEAPSRIVSAIVVINFEQAATRIQRYGNNSKRGGWHVLNDPPNE